MAADFARDLVEVEAGKEVPFDQAREVRIALLESAQRAVELERALGIAGVQRQRLVEVGRVRTASALAGVAAARMIDQDLAHRPRREGIEVRAVAQRPRIAFAE